ncbi:MAG: dienelactone hydrolase family protein [Flavobacteriales bacterium]|nr:dienelactone hydrolase family protein [Flavobacteriales bacterium]
MIEKNIVVSKTARYYQLGEITSKTRNVIIACHGYAQLAKYFLKWFEEADLTDTVIIAPEGLHRFYWEGFNGKVVASWMTKEDRQNDIKDYCNYLDQLVDSIQLPNGVSLMGLGFSQGAATISRWAVQTNHSLNHLILWAGVFPEDVSVEDIAKNIQSPVEILFGNEDEFYNEENLERLKAILTSRGLPYNFTPFVGKHKIYSEPLDKLLKKLTKQ